MGALQHLKILFSLGLSITRAERVGPLSLKNSRNKSCTKHASGKDYQPIDAAVVLIGGSFYLILYSRGKGGVFPKGHYPKLLGISKVERGQVLLLLRSFILDDLHIL